MDCELKFCSICLLEKSVRYFTLYQMRRPSAVCNICSYNDKKKIKKVVVTNFCLKCDLPFPTTFGHRVCDLCKKTEEWINGDKYE